MEVIRDLIYPVVAEKLQTASNLAAVIEKRSKRQVNPRAALDSEISRAARELETINERLAGLYENYAERILTEQEYVRVKAEYERRAGSLHQRMDELSERAAVVAGGAVSENRWLKAAREFQNPVALTKDMLDAIVERIVVYGPERINIVWKFTDEFALLETCAGEEAC